MATFKDINGKEWQVLLDGPTILRVRKACELDLADPTGAAYERVADDPVLTYLVFWELCRDQAERDGVTQPQFGQSLTGDAIDRAADAMLESMADFFRKSQRELLKAATTRNQKARELIVAEIHKKIDDPELLKQEVAEAVSRMDQEIRGRLTPPSAATSSPAPSASDPTD